MARTILVASLILIALRVVHGAAAPSCSNVDGYVFYRLQEAAGAYTIQSITTTITLTSLAAACAKTPRCNAFTTAGKLQTVPMAPIFSVLDGSDPDMQPCDGVYIVQTTLTGLNLPAGVNADTMRQAGAKKLLDMQAAQAAAAKVAAKLLARGINPRNDPHIDRTALVKAFKDSKTPRAQSSNTSGSYTFGDVMAALVYPVWDSRTANGTAYNYISPVKDQRSCGSCVSFAATAAAETAVAVRNGTVSNANDYSEEWLFFCNDLYAPTCSNGWYASQASDVLVKLGTTYEINYPYISAPNCTLASSPMLRPGGNFSSVVYGDVTLAKQHIRTYGSVMTNFAVYNDFFNWAGTSQPYVWDGVSSLAGYHEVQAIGYNDTGSYWIGKNSWGAGWGDGGFFRISYVANVGFMSGSGDNILGVSWTGPNAPQPSPSPSPAPVVCGDGVCSANETCATCAADCGACAVCGDGICSGSERCSTCLADCGVVQPNGTRSCCGDGVCSAAAGETCSSCSKDCGVCVTCNKNGICEPGLGEKCSSGKAGCSDCGTCSGSYCGDGKCTSSRKGYSETCSSCPTDCGACVAAQYCGNGICESSRLETVNSCPRDCKATKLPVVAVGVSQSASRANSKKPSRRSLLE